MVVERNDLAEHSAISDKTAFWLQRELDEAHKTIRSLLRQIAQEQARCSEIARAYNMTVANLVEATRENATLAHERDLLKARVEGSAAPFKFGASTLELTPAEIGAIRKAIARLHHPDAGGNLERMKQWNAALDALEC
jgi:hypothetical protein